METKAVNTTAELEKELGMSEQELFSFVEYHAEDAERIGYSEYSYWKSVFRNFLKNKAAVVMIIVFFAIFIFSFVALWIGKYDYQHLIPDTNLCFQSPNSEYWFGTDNLGRDYWCQVWYATQTSIKLAAIVALGECLMGVTIGCIWGYVRKADRFFTELYNIFDSVPTMIYMTLIALFIGQTFWIMCASIILFHWMYMAKNVRNLVFMYRDREYNLASRCLGTSIFKIATKNILPFMTSVIVTLLATELPSYISYEVFLSYIGMGMSEMSLGRLIYAAEAAMVTPGGQMEFWSPVAIASIITVVLYVVGQNLGDASDPRTHM